MAKYLASLLEMPTRALELSDIPQLSVGIPLLRYLTMCPPYPLILPQYSAAGSFFDVTSLFQE